MSSELANHLAPEHDVSKPPVQPSAGPSVLYDGHPSILPILSKKKASDPRSTPPSDLVVSRQLALILHYLSPLNPSPLHCIGLQQYNINRRFWSFQRVFRFTSFQSMIKVFPFQYSTNPSWQRSNRTRSSRTQRLTPSAKWSL